MNLQVQASATRLRVGESVQLVAMIAGPGLLRQAQLVWPRKALEASSVAPELFAEPGRHTEQPGLRSMARRSETLVVVPHATGELWVPPVEVDFWHPDEARYVTLSSEPFSIGVDPEAPAPPRDVRASPATGRGADERRDTSVPRWLWAVALVAGAFGVQLVLRARRRAGRDT